MAEVNGAGAGAAAEGAAASGSGSEAQGSGSGSPPQSGGQPQGVANPGGQAQSKQFSYQEDRTDWVSQKALRDRLKQQDGSHQKALADMQAKLEANERRLRLAMGVETQDPDAVKAAETRAAILQLIPELEPLLEKETLQDLLETAKQGKVMAQTTAAQWNRHATQMLGSLKSMVAEKTGMTLTPRQVERLNREYTVFVQRSFQERQAAIKAQDESYDFDNDVYSRHNNSDETLLEAFTKDFLDDWYEPVKRQTTSAQARRLGRPVPSGGRDRKPMTQGAPQIDYNDEEAFKNALRAARQG